MSIESGRAARTLSADAVCCTIIFALWIAAICIVNPVGNFPITDDWAFAESVRSLVEKGELRFSDWASMNLISHVLWGSLFAALLGTDYTILRLSTLVAALLGALAFYRLARLSQMTPSAALLSALALLFNPLSFVLSFTFMSDVSFTAMQLGAMCFLAGAALQRSRLQAAAGWLFAALAVLSRQTGLAIAVGTLLEAAARRKPRVRTVIVAALPLAGLLALQWGYQSWLVASGLAPKGYGRQIGDLIGRLAAQPADLVSGAVRMAFFAFSYIGFFALPIAAICIPRWQALLPKRWRWAALALVIASAAGYTAFLLAQDIFFPMWQNTVLRDGLGTDLAGPRFPWWLLALLTFLASLGGMLLSAAAAAAVFTMIFKRRRRFELPLFAAAVGLVLLAPMFVMPIGFDRYFVPIIPCAMLALAGLLRKWTPGPWLLAGYGALIVPAALSVAGTRDFMAAKRVHQQAYTELTRQVPARFVDAGFAVNGPSFYAKFGAQDRPCGWYERADYIVRAGREDPRRGYVAIRRLRVSRWLSWGADDAPVLVLRRDPRVKPDTTIEVCW